MQLSIFELQEQVLIPISNETKIIEKIPDKNNEVEILKEFNYETKIFKVSIKIGKINNKYDYTLHYSFQTGTYEGCGIPWNYDNDKHLFSDKELALNHCKKYFLMRINHISERSDTTSIQKTEVPKIIDFVNNIFI